MDLETPVTSPKASEAFQLNLFPEEVQAILIRCALASAEQGAVVRLLVPIDRKDELLQAASELNLECDIEQELADGQIVLCLKY